MRKLPLALLCCCGNLFAQVFFDFSSGSALNIPTPLVVSQNGFPDINLTARYSTRPFSDDAWAYYMGRIGWQSKKTKRVFALELLHHKIYLQNTTDEVQELKITFGYNMLFLNFGWHGKYFSFLLGAGPVITHAESTIRGEAFKQSGILGKYGFAGVAGQMAVLGRVRWWIFGLFAEIKLTAAYAQVPISNGNATAPNIAAHGLVGASFVF